MGITYRDADMYLNAKQGGASFDRTTTLGRQGLYLHRRDIADLNRRYSALFGKSPTSLAAYRWGDFADDFFREFLGVGTLAVLDISDYEGADFLHDMNEPIPRDWRNQYDAVIDSGSLEHIFNVPVALRNLADMVKVGGTIFLTTPANNLMGHGFYQFSPELMFRVFSKENGFTLRSLKLFESAYPSAELTRNSRVYEVTDPQHVHRRVGLISKRPATMMVEAVKLADVEMFAKPPMQSDYVDAWTSSTIPAPRSRSLARKALSSALNSFPWSVKAHISGFRERRSYSLGNDQFYQPLPR